MHLGQSSEDIEIVRQALSALKADHLAQFNLVNSPDQKYDAGIVDTFLHYRDKAYTVEDCLELVGKAGLRFQGWKENFFYYPEFQVPRIQPFFDRIRKLPEPKIWQLMELFHGRILLHCFYACRPSRDVKTYLISFEEDAFMSYVPFLRFDCGSQMDDRGTAILERPGFPKVTLSSEQAAIFRQIDGHKTIRECFTYAHVVPDPPIGPIVFCREMFCALWQLSYCDFALTAPTQSPSS